MKRLSWGAAVLTLACTVLNFWQLLVAHYSLRTNAFDASVSDYLLWNLLHRGIPAVPFQGFSVLSVHFMPVFALLLPFYALWPTPVGLMALQVVAFSAAAWLYHRYQRTIGLDGASALMLLAVFLLSRRSHNAVASVFYPECLQAALTFGIVLTWGRSAWQYWPLAIVFLMTKEDASIYLAAFAAWKWWSSPARRQRALTTVAIACVWFAFALTIAVPTARKLEGLAPGNAIMGERFGGTGSGALQTSLRRLATTTAASRAANLAVTAGLLPLASPTSLIPAVPGIIANLAVRPDMMQAELTGHYVWPILPWLFIAAADAAVKLRARVPHLTTVWLVVLLGGTVLDSPSLRLVNGMRVDRSATAVLGQLKVIPMGGVTVAQANLIPHLPHSAAIFPLASGVQPAVAPDTVLITTVGDLWPLNRDQLEAIKDKYESDPQYESRSTPPLFAFQKRR